MPGSGFIKQIHPKYRTPINSILVTCIIAFLLTVYAAAYYVVTSISTIALYLAYGIPIYLNWRNKRKKQGEYTTPETAPWNLGKWGPFINVIAFTWIGFITILFILPPNELTLWTMVALGIFMVIYWQLGPKHWFEGPKKASEEELRRIEEELEKIIARGDD